MPGDLATPRPSRPSSPPTKPSVVIPPGPAQAPPSDTSSTENSTPKPDPTSSAPSTLASLTCATPLTPHTIASTTAHSENATNPTPVEPSDRLANPSAGIGISPDIIAVGNLLSTMKMTLGALSATFDFLGAQTEKAAALGPAIEATHQISTLRAQLVEQYAGQETRIQNIKAQLRTVLTEQLSNQLQSSMETMIQDIVAKEIKKRVESQLQVQIPNNLRDQVMHHKRQILEVQTKLHNSEARRYNATLRSMPFTEPLRPLLRPLATPLQSPPRTAHSHPTAPPTPAVPHAPAPTPTVWKDPTIPPSASRLFPRDLSSLFDLNSDDARALVRDYGLEDADEAADDAGLSGAKKEGAGGGEVQQVPTPTSATGDAGSKSGVGGAGNGTARADDSRERNLTRFMVHIGVPYRMVPDPNSTKRKKLAPLITTF